MSDFIPEEGSKLEVSWKFEAILASYIVAVTGSIVGVNLMERRRSCADSSAALKFRLLLVAGVSIAGVAIWCMHFIGMAAMVLTAKNPNGPGEITLPIKFDVGMAVVSFLAALVLCFAGLYISSNDPYFDSNMEKIRKQLVVGMGAGSMSQARSKRFAMYIALFRNTQNLVIGGVVAGGGVCSMHYLDMQSQVFDGEMEWNWGILILSVIIACVAATAAFWILFRLLVFRASSEWLRVASALIMGVAVCGMHYTGMYAADFKYVAGKMEEHSGATVSQTGARSFAFNAGFGWSIVLSLYCVASERLRNSPKSSKAHTKLMKAAKTLEQTGDVDAFLWTYNQTLEARSSSAASSSAASSRAGNRGNRGKASYGPPSTTHSRQGGGENKTKRYLAPEEPSSAAEGGSGAVLVVVAPAAVAAGATVVVGPAGAGAGASVHPV